MADQNDDLAQAERIKIAEMVTALGKLAEGHTVGEIQHALGNFVADMALRNPEPEVTVLTTIEIMSEIYRKMRRAKLGGSKPAN